MSNEARVTISLSIRKVSDTGVVLLDPTFRSSFTADVEGTKGGTPGSITVLIDGTDIDLSELTTPGWCFLKNQDDTNYVEIGIREPVTAVFYPLIELLPGEATVIRLSRNIQEEYTNTGTGTTGPTNFLHAKANGASINLLVEAFEK